MNCILNRNHHRRLFQYAVLAALAEAAAALAVVLALQVAAVLPAFRAAYPDGYLLAEFVRLAANSSADALLSSSSF